MVYSYQLDWYGYFYPWMKPMPMGKVIGIDLPEKQLVEELSRNEIRPSEEKNASKREVLPYERSAK